MLGQFIQKVMQPIWDQEWISTSDQHFAQASIRRCLANEPGDAI
jgi:hypothetical protein